MLIKGRGGTGHRCGSASHDVVPCAPNTIKENLVAEVVEFTLNVKPGHYAEVLSLYSDFAHTYLEINPAFVSMLVVGDEGSGIVRGIGVYTDHVEAAAVNSDGFFGDFMDVIEPLIEGAPSRVLLDLVHAWSK
jgi:hypothetical protein